MKKIYTTTATTDVAKDDAIELSFVPVELFMLIYIYGSFLNFV